MKPFNWGLVSTARINDALIPAIRESAEGRLLGVASRDAGRAAAYAAERGIPRSYGSYRALLDDPEIDVVYVNLPNHLHAEWTLAALRAGKHVLCEKPFTLREADLDAIEAEAASRGLVAAEAFMYRHHPQTALMGKLVAEGALGEIRAMDGIFTFALDNPDDYRLRADQGGGALWDVGVYPLGMSLFLAGSEPVDVDAFFARRDGDGVDMSCSAALRFPCGAEARFFCSFEAPDGVGFRVVGTEGILEATRPFWGQEDEAARLELRRRDGSVESIPVPRGSAYRLEVDDLHDAARGRKLPEVSFDESRRVLRAVLAMQGIAGR